MLCLCYHMDILWNRPRYVLIMKSVRDFTSIPCQRILHVRPYRAHGMRHGRKWQKMSSRNKYANASTMASSFLFPYGSAISARVESTSDICLLYHPQVDVGLGHATEGGMQTYITTICNILFSKPYHSLLLSILPPPTPLVYPPFSSP